MTLAKTCDYRVAVRHSPSQLSIGFHPPSECKKEVKAGILSCMVAIAACNSLILRIEFGNLSLDGRGLR